MKLKKLFEQLKRLKPNRKNYRIKPSFKIWVDDRDYYFSFLPTILWEPWIYRYPNSEDVVDIWWLNIHISIGTWASKETGEENIG